MIAPPTACKIVSKMKGARKVVYRSVNAMEKPRQLDEYRRDGK